MPTEANPTPSDRDGAFGQDIVLADVAPSGRLPNAGESEDPDPKLVASALAGKRDAFETLLRRHYDRIYRVAWRLSGSGADAEDIAQDVCCTLVEKIGTFRGQSKFTTWLVGIVVNACRDHRRRKAAISRLHHNVAVLAELAPSPDGRDLYDRAWLTSAIGRLDRPLRDTVILVIGEDMSHGEAASVLDVAEATISWRMHRVRQILTAEQTEEVSDDL